MGCGGVFADADGGCGVGVEKNSNVMVDADYKIVVGVEAKANTKGLEDVNKGLAEVKQTVGGVNQTAADGVEGMEALGEAVGGAAEAFGEVEDAAEGVQEAVKQVGQAGKATGEAISQGAGKAAGAVGRLGKAAQQTQSKLMALKGKFVASLNAVNELKGYWELGKSIGQGILDWWERYVDGIDRAAVKRVRDLKDRLMTEAAARDRAYSNALNSAERHQAHVDEAQIIESINRLYEKRLTTIQRLAEWQEGEIDHLEALRKKELELQKIRIETQRMRGEISGEDAEQQMADLEEADGRADAKTRVDRQEVAVKKAMEEAEVRAGRVADKKAKLSELQNNPYNIDEVEYNKLVHDRERLMLTVQERDEAEKEKRKLEKEITRQELLTKAKLPGLPGELQRMDDVSKGMEANYDRVRELNKIIERGNGNEAEVKAIEERLRPIEEHYRAQNPHAVFEAGRAGEDQFYKAVLDDIAIYKTRLSELEDDLKAEQEALKVASWEVDRQERRLVYVKELNAKEKEIAEAKAMRDVAGADAGTRRRSVDQLERDRDRVKGQWNDRVGQLKAGEGYKDWGSPALERLLREGQRMADAGAISEQDAVSLGRMMDVALKGLPREIRPAVRRMVEEVINGFSGIAVKEREVLLPEERKRLEQDRLGKKLADLPAFKADSSAAKIVEVLEDVVKYGTLSEATLQQLRGLTMRINASDEDGQRVVSLVKDLVSGELRRLLGNMDAPAKIPVRVSPSGRDLGAEGVVRERLQLGGDEREYDYSALVGEFSRQMMKQSNARILDVMGQFVAIAKQVSEKGSSDRARLSAIEREVAALQSRGKFGR